MATLIPAIGTCVSRMTGGEKRIARRLEDKLEDDWLIWYDVPLGPRNVHPDFVVFNPRRGLLVLEVKDWRLDTIQEIDRQSVSLLTPNGLKRQVSPLEQARQYAHEVVDRIIRAVDANIIPGGQYDAVLIDEGHDFQPEWLKLVAQMLNPGTSSLLVLYDDAQSIYGRDKRGKISFKSLGIQALGRTTILKINYRNTQEVLELASGIARDLLKPSASDEDGVPLVAPISAGRHGPKPLLI